VLKEAYESMLVILLGTFIPHWGEPSDGYRPTTSRPFELSSNTVVASYSANSSRPTTTLTPYTRHRSNALNVILSSRNRSDGCLRPAIRVVQLRCARAGQLEELGD